MILTQIDERGYSGTEGLMIDTHNISLGVAVDTLGNLYLVYSDSFKGVLVSAADDGSIDWWGSENGWSGAGDGVFNFP